MLSKVRARHGIELPVEKWGNSTGLVLAIMSLALLFVVIPLAASLLRGLFAFTAMTLIGLGSGLVALFALALFTRT